MNATGSDRHTHVHEAGFYRGDDEFAELIVGFVDSAVAAGEPVIIGYDERKNEIVRSGIADHAGVTFIEDATLYATPTRAIASYRRLFEQHIGRGARRIRIAGDVPHPGNGRSFDGWDRYESAVNTVWRDLPVWSRCLYDATTVPEATRAVVERTHPRLVDRTGPTPNPAYQDPRDFQVLPPTPDPLEDTPPAIELVGCSPAGVREAVRSFARERLDADVLDDLVFAASEAVANAHQHGRAPVTVRIRGTAGRVLVTVQDSGPGPADRFAGLVPAESSPTGAGLGLWISHQLAVATDLVWAATGFTVRLRAGSDLDARRGVRT